MNLRKTLDLRHIARHRLRLLAYIAAGLVLAALAGATSVILNRQARAQEASRVEITQIQLHVTQLQALPWSLLLPSSPFAVNAEGVPNVRRAMASQQAAILSGFDQLDRAGTGEDQELDVAARLEAENYASLLRELAQVKANHLLPAWSEYQRGLTPLARTRTNLDQASNDLSSAASAASLRSDIGTGAAIAIAALVSVLLFLRLRRQEIAAGSEHSMLEHMIESSSELIIAFDRKRCYTVWNRTAEQVTGRTRSEMLGSTAAKLASVGVGADEIEAGHSALRGETVELRNRTYTAPDGSPRTWDLVYAPVYDPNGRIVGGLIQGHDVTMRNELDARLRDAQKLEAVGRLAGGMAHEFNNLLMGITGHASLARTRLNNADPLLARDLELIERSANDAGSLTLELLGFARRQVRRPQVLEIDAVVRSFNELLRLSLTPDVALELDLSSGVRVEADKQQLQQVLLNLTTNACDAMPAGGRLTIRTRSVEGPDGSPVAVEVTVTDTGRGIPDDVKNHLFEPFISTKEVGAGGGLGLASTFGIVTQSGGSIDVESEPGRGTTFRITLPVAAAPAQSDPAVTVPAAPGRRVLLVEDNATVRDLVASGLEDQGYEVVATSHPNEALAQVERSGRCDLLLTDLVMPEMSGDELARRIVARLEQPVRTIYMSGYPRSGFVLEQGATFLQKPFGLDELYAAVDEQLATSRPA